MHLTGLSSPSIPSQPAASGQKALTPPLSVAIEVLAAMPSSVPGNLSEHHGSREAVDAPLSARTEEAVAETLHHPAAGALLTKLTQALPNSSSELYKMLERFFSALLDLFNSPAVRQHQIKNFVDTLCKMTADGGGACTLFTSQSNPSDRMDFLKNMEAMCTELLQQSGRDPQDLRSLGRDIEAAFIKKMSSFSDENDPSGDKCKSCMRIITPMLSAIQKALGECVMRTEEVINLDQTLRYQPDTVVYSLQTTDGADGQKHLTAGPKKLDEPVKAGELLFSAPYRLNEDLERVPAVVNGQRCENLSQLLACLKREGVPENKYGELASLFSQGSCNALNLIIAHHHDLSSNILSPLGHEVTLSIEKDGTFTATAHVITEHIKLGDPTAGLFSSAPGTRMIRLLDNTMELRGDLSTDDRLKVTTTVHDLLRPSGEPMVGEVVSASMKSIQAASDSLNIKLHPMRRDERDLFIKLIKPQQDGLEREINSLRLRLEEQVPTIAADGSDSAQIQEDRAKMAELKQSLNQLNSKIDDFREVTIENKDTPESQELLTWARGIIAPHILYDKAPQ